MTLLQSEENRWQPFSSHWRRVIHTKRLCFSRTFDAFWYFITKYHLISYLSTSLEVFPFNIHLQITHAENNNNVKHTSNVYNHIVCIGFRQYCINRSSTAFWTKITQVFLLTKNSCCLWFQSDNQLLRIVWRSHTTLRHDSSNGNVLFINQVNHTSNLHLRTSFLGDGGVGNITLDYS